MNLEHYQKLKALPQKERFSYLQSLGMPASEANDLLDSLTVSTQRVAPTGKPYKISDVEWQNVLARTQNPELISLPTPEDIRSESERKFARDIMLNQFLMEVSSRYDDASLHNPKLKKTYVTTWFYEVFRLSNKGSALLLGNKGAGKTWGMLAYVNSLTQTRGSLNKITWSDSMFITAFKLSELFHNSKKNQDKLEEVMRKKHLMIDDLGAEPSGFRGSDFIAYFDYLFSERHKYKRNTYITSNATPDQIKELYGERFVSRFNEIGLMCVTADPDMRV